jgi:nucleoid DNA-binding protein
MKIEQLLARHLYAAKKLTLQGIGTFSLPDNFILPAETDKPAEIPQDTITFTQNAKAAEDEALIDFIVQHSRKMKALASSDLESFISLGTQFLNIGKPLKIEGIGTLDKHQSGQYVFTQYGQFIGAKAEEPPVQAKEKREESFSYAKDDNKGKGNGKKIILALLALVIAAGAGWAAWYFITNKKQQSITTAQPVTPAFTAPVKDTTKKDSLPVSQMPDPVPIAPISTANGSYTFKVVIKSYPSLAIAQKRYDKLTSYGHKLIMYTQDSVNYKVAMPLTLPLSDTTYALDSVRKKLFGGTPYIELQ